MNNKDCSVPLLLANSKDRFSRVKTHIENGIIHIDRILHKWSFYMKFMIQALEFDKLQMK